MTERCGPPTAPALAQGARRAAVLVIDDDPLVASILQRVLASEHTVRIEVSAAAALRLLQTKFFDAVVTDVNMPELSGFALFEALAASCPAQAERMVFVTGGVWAGEAEDRLLATGRPILQKPFDVKALRDAVRAVVQAAAPPLAPEAAQPVDPEPPSP